MPHKLRRVMMRGRKPSAAAAMLLSASWAEQMGLEPPVWAYDLRCSLKKEMMRWRASAADGSW